MTAEISADIEGLEQALERFVGMGKRARDLEPVWQAIRGAFLASEERRFTTQGYGDWAPDVASTVTRKARKGQDLRTMRATSALHRSLTSEDAPGAVYQPGADTLVLGTNVFDAHWSQTGSGARHRPVVVVTDSMRGQWAELLRRHVMDGD